MWGSMLENSDRSPPQFKIDIRVGNRSNFSVCGEDSLAATVSVGDTKYDIYC